FMVSTTNPISIFSTNTLDIEAWVKRIAKEGKPQWAVMPYDFYLRLIENTKFEEDVLFYEKTLADEDDELIPLEVVSRIADGETLVRVWREYRGLTQRQLADMARISKPYLSQIESNRRIGTAETLAALAEVLDLKVDDLIRLKETSVLR
ncbi:helix-turn-helix transcriptional regulator, partial [Candidatus Parabeggiatoa sp. HSG14]|uniref:helix-turn-helix domain-containing protein n=1 Tax=Candidatus Parabeggiatoa sp. HSG14 TaxID=3055593 RepID=UPI0025A7EF60|nr:helix-turn-helix transcriptional regulator [Thiotrichales bacterium HSG14]